MKRLLLNHAFKFVESVVFFVGEENVRSQKAMEKVGAIKVGTATRTYGNHPPARNVKYVIRNSSPARRNFDLLDVVVNSADETTATIVHLHVRKGRDVIFRRLRPALFGAS